MTGQRDIQAQTSLSPKQMAKRMEDIGVRLDVLVGYLDSLSKPTHDKFFTDLKSLYFGSHINHPSMFREGESKNRRGRTIDEKPTRPMDLPPFARLIGDLHHIFRAQIPQRLNIHVDEERLPKETQELMKEFRTTLLCFQKEVKKIAKEKKGRGETEARYPFTEAMNPQFLGDIEASLIRIINGLDSSALASNPRQPNKLPITMDGEKIEIDNIDNIGLSLFALDLSVNFQLNSARVPTLEAQYFIVQYAGSRSQILAVMRECYSSDPILLAQYENVFAAFYPRAVELLHEHSHALQMAHLIEQDIKFTFECKHLLTEAHAAHYPERLETPLECALVLASLPNYRKIPGVEALITQCLDMENRKRSHLGQPVITTFLRTPLPDKADEKNLIKINLVKDYLIEQQKQKWKSGSEGKTRG